MSQETILPKELQTQLKTDKDTVVIDVRTPEEFAQGHIPGAKLFPLGSWTPHQLISMIQAEHPNHRKVYVACASGMRAGKACELLRESDIENIVLIEGGTAAWIAGGFPIEKS